MSPFSQQEEARIASLRRFLEGVRRANTDDDGEFHALFYQGQVLLEVTDLAIAEALRVSRPTVNRWARGRNLPHKALRPAIVRWLESQAHQRVKWLSEQLAGAASGRRMTAMLASRC